MNNSLLDNIEGGKQMNYLVSGKQKRSIWMGLLSALILVSMVWVGPAQAQTKYPTRPIDIICPFGAGGAADLTHRLLAEFASKELKVPINVVNKPGGATIPALLEVYSSTPDGYTMLGDCRNSASLLPYVVKDLPFKIMDRTFIAITNYSPHLLVLDVNSSLKTMDDVVAELKKNPSNFTWATSGASSTQDYMMRQFCKAVGVDINKTKAVVTSGGAQVAALIGGGQVKLGIVSAAAGMSLIKGRLVRPILISSAKRDIDFPDVPTGAEVGYPTVNMTFWIGISGPPKLPSNVIDIWGKALQKIIRDPIFVARSQKMGLPVIYKGSAEVVPFIKKEMEEISELMSSTAAR
jgi:tripartite-type tricarboxylate transporter receptor subunit TctC